MSAPQVQLSRLGENLTISVIGTKRIPGIAADLTLEEWEILKFKGDRLLGIDEDSLAIAALEEEIADPALWLSRHVLPHAIAYLEGKRA